MHRPVSRPLWTAAALFTLACGAAAQPPAVNPQITDAAVTDQAMALIRPEVIGAHMRFLADDLLEGRGTGTRGYDIAAQYVATQLEAAGLEPAGAGGTYFQPVPFRRSVAEEKECSVTLQRQGSKADLRYGVDYIMRVDSLLPESAEVTAPVAFVGFGVTAPELNYDDYAGVDVRGKIVALLTDAPAAFPHNQRAYYSSTRLKGENAVAHGAIGVFIISNRDDRKSFPWSQVVRHAKTGGMRWVDAAGKPDEVWGEIRGSAWLSEQGAAALFQGAPKTIDQALDDADASKPQGFDLPVRATLKSTARHTRVDSPNVAAVLRGSDPRLRDQYVVYTGHLDHVGVSDPVDGDSINNGAFDNASGIAALIEAAKAFVSLPTAPRRSILFVAVTGEEKGLRGSDYFAQHPTVPRERIVANVNLDMFVMPFPLKDVVAFGAEHSSLGPVVEAAAKRVGFTLSPDPAPEEVIFIRSDQYSFVRQGVPAVFITHGAQSADPKIDGPARIVEWMRTRYHRPKDDMDQPMHLESGVKFARLNFLIGYDVAQADQPPTWNPGDFFG
ncbi:MAG TPA: M28 family metallopeptidase, partial [Thermoanaerobaculia bacterium]|nr:M28 family metallopeptidase [Thermoanaerobaculia bacterium]